MGDVIDDIYCWFFSFHLINYTFIPTSCNKASHVPRWYKGFMTFEHVWLEDSLAFIICIVRFCLIKQVAIVSIKKRKRKTRVYSIIRSWNSLGINTSFSMLINFIWEWTLFLIKVWVKITLNIFLTIVREVYPIT